MASRLNRRKFLGVSAAGLGGMALALGHGDSKGEEMFSKGMIDTGRKLKVRPVLTYEIAERKEATSWRTWGGVQTRADLEREKRRIRKELGNLARDAGFGLEVMPLAAVSRVEEVQPVAKAAADVTLIYAAGGSTKLLDAVAASSEWTIIFVRHRSGPVYLWYEIVHPKFLRRPGPDFSLDRLPRHGGMDVYDVVVDDYGEVLWRLRGLYGLKNIRGKKMVALGGPGGWGCRYAPVLAGDKWGMDIVTVTYEDLESRLKSAFKDGKRLDQARRSAREYLKSGPVTLETKRDFVVNAFVLYRVIKDYLEEAGATAFTIKHCMSVVIPIAKTTACLPLSVLNDEGYTAFCESDFNVIPSGVLLHYVSGKPVFLQDPTYPHDGVVTVAHCTAPRRMDGVHYEPTRVVTHFESDYGAAPKVEFTRGQELTVVAPDCAQKAWLGFKGKVLGSPSYEICRSQIDLEIEGDWRKLLEEMKGFHWMLCYGDYLKEMSYAVRKAGVGWVQV